ncbi:MAG: hypothetical protein FD155_3488, partial [Bacteroidetes bacterium]
SGYTYKPDDWNKGKGGATYINPYISSGYQGQMGPGSNNHWSDGIDATRDWWMMSSANFIFNYGSASWNDLAERNLRQRSANGNVADISSVNRANYQTILGWMADGFNISVVNAFGNKVLVGSFGALGTMRYGEGGGLIFSNKSAGMVQGEAVVGVSTIYTPKYALPKLPRLFGLAVDIFGAVNSGREIIEWESIRQGKINRQIANNFSIPVKHSMKAIKVTGKFLGWTSAAVAAYDFIDKPSIGGFMKFGVNTALAGLRTVNPGIGFVVGLSDASGFSDWLVYDRINILTK